MPNSEHLAILADTQAWNRWRMAHPDVQPDLSGADLSGVDLSGTDLSGVDLSWADLRGADLRGPDLKEVVFSWLDASGAPVKEAKLRGTNLSGLNLSGSKLDGVDLSMADLSKADLRQAALYDTNFSNANLSSAKLTGAFLLGTIFVNTNLAGAEGLNECSFTGPCGIDHRTLAQSGDLPIEFLRGCGLSDWEIEVARFHHPDLTSEQINDILYKIHSILSCQTIQVNSLFISYNHKDSPFVDALENHLNRAAIRFWRDVHHATAGRLERQIDRAIRLNPTVLLILSRHSVESDWVQHEARSARKLEIETRRDVLCPVALDGSWESCRWPERLREQLMEYKILDFSSWQDPESFERMFAKLVEGLSLFYAKQSGA